jgi:hypothetical protein
MRSEEFTASCVVQSAIRNYATLRIARPVILKEIELQQLQFVCVSRFRCHIFFDVVEFDRAFQELITGANA